MSDSDVRITCRVYTWCTVTNTGRIFNATAGSVYYDAAVLTASLRVLFVHPSVCPVQAPNSKTKKKTPNWLNGRQCGSNRKANIQFKMSKVGRISCRH